MKREIKISKELYDEIFYFIDGIKQTANNKHTYEEAIGILKKMKNEKV